MDIGVSLRANRLFTRFTLQRAVVFMLIIPTMGALLIVGSFHRYIGRTSTDIARTDIASRQRMLSERLQAYAHMVFGLRQTEDRAELLAIIEMFDQSQHVLEHGGAILNYTLPPLPAEILLKLHAVNRHWELLKPKLGSLVDAPPAKLHAALRNDLQQLTLLADTVVSGFQRYRQQQIDRFYRITSAVFAACLGLLLTGLIIAVQFVNVRKRTENQLVRALKTAEHANKVKTRILNP